MAEKQSLPARLDELAARFDDLEERIDSGSCSAAGRHPDSASHMQYCANPPRPQREFGPEVSADRAAAIIDIAGKWVNDTDLRYYLFDSGPFGGDSSQQNVVRDAFDQWTRVTCRSFQD